MTFKRLVGGVLVAVVLAFALSQTVDAFYINCDVEGWNICWPWG